MEPAEHLGEQRKPRQCAHLQLNSGPDRARQIARRDAPGTRVLGTLNAQPQLAEAEKRESSMPIKQSTTRLQIMPRELDLAELGGLDTASGECACELDGQPESMRAGPPASRICPLRARPDSAQAEGGSPYSLIGSAAPAHVG